MLERKERGQLELFVSGSLRQVVPDDHVLARFDRVLDLSWPAGGGDRALLRRQRPAGDRSRSRSAVDACGVPARHRPRPQADAGSAGEPRPCAGSPATVCNETLPDHSSLTRIRRRWGVERLRRIFQRTVQACVDAGVAKGEIVSIDASLIRADVSWESLTVLYAEASADANGDVEDAAKKARETGKDKNVCVTDPDATMAIAARNRRLEPAFKQHAAVDDEKGVIFDVAVTTG